ncbi:hypothetical protein D3C75_1138210 [compost metagenome]
MSATPRKSAGLRQLADGGLAAISYQIPVAGALTPAPHRGAHNKGFSLDAS